MFEGLWLLEWRLWWQSFFTLRMVLIGPWLPHRQISMWQAGNQPRLVSRFGPDRVPMWSMLCLTFIPQNYYHYYYYYFFWEIMLKFRSLVLLNKLKHQWTEYRNHAIVRTETETMQSGNQLGSYLSIDNFIRVFKSCGVSNTRRFTASLPIFLSCSNFWSSLLHIPQLTITTFVTSWWISAIRYATYPPYLIPTTLYFSTTNLFIPSPTQIAWNRSEMSVLLVWDSPKNNKSGMYKLKLLDKSLTWKKNCHLELPPKPWIRTTQGLFVWMSRIAFLCLAQSKRRLVTSCRAWNFGLTLF